MQSYFKSIRINHHSIVPKYRQLADAIIIGMHKGLIQKEETLPSLHSLCVLLDVSKNTVEKAYNTLKKRGVINSCRGKGHAIADDKILRLS